MSAGHLITPLQGAKSDRVIMHQFAVIVLDICDPTWQLVP